MFDVHVINASPSQKPIVSPNHCGTSGPSRGTTPLLVELAADVDLRDERLGGVAHVEDRAPAS